MEPKNFNEVLDLYTDTAQYDREERRNALDDMIFINAEDGQWREDITEKSRERPRYTVDRVSGAVEQVVGDQRQTEYSIRVVASDAGSPRIAKIYTGMIREIEKRSNANTVYDRAFYEQVVGGYGGWRVLTEYESHDTFNQKLCIKPIVSAASSLYFDPAAVDVSLRDAEFAFYSEMMSREKFKKNFPDASCDDFPTEHYKDLGTNYWNNELLIRVAEYWYKEYKTKEILLLSDGRVVERKKVAPVLDELREQGVVILRSRTVKCPQVKKVLMSGAEFLEEPQEWAGSMIPLVPLYGRTMTVEGNRYTRGIVRKAKDAQRIYNYAVSSTVEASARTIKDPYWATHKQAEGNKPQWRRMNVDNPPVLFYTHDGDSPGPPKRSGAPSLQSALIEQSDRAARDVHATTGIEPASLGNVPALKSGKAIRLEQSMGDRGTYVFQDKLRDAIQHTGEILVDLIPKIYDTERTVQTYDREGSTESVVINQMVLGVFNEARVDEETGETVIINDLSKGRYVAEVRSGAPYASKRQETVAQLVELAAQSPLVQELTLDVIIENLELNQGEEIKSRIRRDMIKRGVVEPTEEERREWGLDQEPQADPLDDAMVENVRMQTEKLIADIENKDADTLKKLSETQGTTIKGLRDLIQALADKLDAGAAPNPADVDMLEGQTAIVQEGQETALGVRPY